LGRAEREFNGVSSEVADGWEVVKPAILVLKINL
jgi:hypothetical protein